MRTVFGVLCFICFMTILFLLMDSLDPFIHFPIYLLSGWFAFIESREVSFSIHVWYTCQFLLLFQPIWDHDDSHESTLSSLTEHSLSITLESESPSHCKIKQATNSSYQWPTSQINTVFFYKTFGAGVRQRSTSWIIIKIIEAEWRIYASINYPSLVQIMACRLIGAKPLSEPMLEYC